MQFYETKMGNCFFNRQIPTLLSILERIATALERPAPAFRLPAEMPPEYLSDLYYGNLEPDQQVDNKAIRRYTKELCGMQETLQQRLAAKDFALVEELQRTLDLRCCEETKTAFEVGFRTAMQMVMAGLSVPDENKESGGNTDDRD